MEGRKSSAVVEQTALGIAGLAGLGTIAGFWARRSWPCELASHFPVQYAWMLLPSALILLIAHRFLPATVATGLGLVNLWRIVPLYARRAPASKGPPFRVVLANVRSSNTSADLVSRFLHEVDADIVVLQEMTEVWLSELRVLIAEYPYCKSVILERGFGIMLLSRMPVESAEIVRVRAEGLPVVIGRLQYDGHPLTVVSAHPLAPLSPRRLRMRNELLAALAEFIRSISGPVLLLGDLNATSWTPAFKDLLRASGLQDSRRGFGVQGSWPVQAPWMRIAIDHCLVSSDLTVRTRRIGPNIGSDHYPVIIECALGSGTVATYGFRRATGRGTMEIM